MNGEWDIIISSLQDVCQSNQSRSIDNQPVDAENLGKHDSEEQLRTLGDSVREHKESVDKSLRLIQPVLDNLQRLIDLKQSSSGKPPLPQRSAGSSVSSTTNATTATGLGSPSAGSGAAASSTSTGPGSSGNGSTGPASGSGGASPLYTRASSVSTPSAGKGAGMKKRRGEVMKKGRSYYSSPYNPSEPIVVGSEVAFRLKSVLGEEWIQCEVTKVIDHTKFDVRDPEPDENNNPGRTYRASWKEVSLIPTAADARELISYPFGTKVIARYPETTTFYPAEVIGTKRDGRCRLRFEGEEEVGKETEVERRLVLPYPDPRSHN